MNNKFIKLLNFLKIIPFYYITKSNSIYLYVLSISLYNIYSVLFSNISILPYIKDKYYIYVKNKIFSDTLKKIFLINILFIIISIILSDITSIIFKIDHTFMIFIVMSMTISLDRIVSIFREYILSFKYKKLANNLYNLYFYLDIFLFILISIFCFNVFKLPNHISICLIYLPKLISFAVVTILTYFKTKDLRVNDNKMDDKNINYKKINKDIFRIDNKTIALMVRNVYFYISILLMYLILNNRYDYDTNYISDNIVFSYYYSLNIILFIIDIIRNKCNNIKDTLTTYIYKVFKSMVTVSVMLSLLAYPILNIIFNSITGIAYVIWISIYGIFIIIYQELFNYIRNKKLVYFSLIFGLIVKVILLIPLVDSIYRMGYNLIYGDIISSILGMTMSIVINYVYIRNVYKLKNNNYLEKIFRVVYDNLFLLFILLLLEFCIPIKSNNKLISLLVIILYILIGYIYFKIKRVKKK